MLVDSTFHFPHFPPFKCCFIYILDKSQCSDPGICSGIGSCVNLYGGYNCIKNTSTAMGEEDDRCTYYVLSTICMPFN